MKTASQSRGQDVMVSRPSSPLAESDAEPIGDGYFYRRAEDELDRARRARHPEATEAHYVLAGFYLDRFYGGVGGLADRLELIADGDYLPGDGDHRTRFPGEPR